MKLQKRLTQTHNVLTSETWEHYDCIHSHINIYSISFSFPVAQMVEHGASNAKIMGSIPRESKSW